MRTTCYKFLVKNTRINWGNKKNLSAKIEHYLQLNFLKIGSEKNDILLL
jgi:hypothetical protein